MGEYINNYWWIIKLVREYKYEPILKDGIMGRTHMFEKDELVYCYLLRQVVKSTINKIISYILNKVVVELKPLAYNEANVFFIIFTF